MTGAASIRVSRTRTSSTISRSSTGSRRSPRKRACTPAPARPRLAPRAGDDIIPIPGTKRRAYLEENLGALAVQLTRERPRADQRGDAPGRGGGLAVSRATDEGRAPVSRPWPSDAWCSRARPGTSPSGCSASSASGGIWCRSTCGPPPRAARPSPGSWSRDLTKPNRNEYRQHFPRRRRRDPLRLRAGPRTRRHHLAEQQRRQVLGRAPERGARLQRLPRPRSRKACDASWWPAPTTPPTTTSGSCGPEKLDMVTPEMPPRSDNWYGWSKAAYELLGFVFATGQVDGKKLEVVQWRIGGPRDDDIDHVKPGDIKVMHRALGAYLSRRDQVQQAIRMVGDREHRRRARRPLPDRLRHQRQHAPLLEPRQRAAEARLCPPGRQPGELRRQDRGHRSGGSSLPLSAPH